LIDQRVFLDFEYVFTVCVAIILVLMYLFYVRYPYGGAREIDGKGRAAGDPTTADSKGRS